MSKFESINEDDPEWDKLTEKIVCGNTECLRYCTVQTIIDKLTSPGCGFDHVFVDMLLLCLPSFTTPLEFFNSLSDKLFAPQDVNKFIIEQIQMKVLYIFRSWATNPCAYTDMSSGALLVSNSHR